MRPSALDPERWRQIDAVLETALQTPPDELAGFLDAACGDDKELKREVEALLEAKAGGDSHFEPPGAALMKEALSSWAGPVVEGRMVGPFRLRREIGRGGMGVVYLAEDTRLGRQVALKVLPPWLGTGQEAKQRFEAEARAVSALDHANIATLYEIDESEDGQLYMVFAFYDGETLEARIARGPLAAGEAVEITIQIVQGLGAAHGKGVIHRDVKPSNVLLCRGGEVKLLDFGVAKMAGEKLTGEGIRLGTLGYMSPERLRDEPIDGRADLWSLGIVLYEMLSGAHPFRGTDAPSLIHSILDEEPEPPVVPGGEISDALERILRKLLSKDSAGRYQNADDLLIDLRSTRDGRAPPVVTREPPPAFRSRIRRLAVLPLADLTGDPRDEHVVHGVHHALIAELGKVRALGVVSRTSVARFRDSGMSIPEVASLLDVDAVVDGSVSRVGDDLAVTVQLIAASSERHLWAGTFRRGMDGVLDVAAEVARAIAREVGITLSPSEDIRLRAARPVTPAAYEAYTMGVLYLERRSPDGHEQAQKYLRRAIELDPGFAPAHAMLAEACGSAAFFGLVSPADGIPMVRALVEQALTLDASLPAAHTVLGAVRHFGDWDWAGAETALHRAIALNPSYGYAHFMLSDVLAVQRRHAEALAAAERYRALEPFVPFSAFGPVYVLVAMRDFDRAIDRTRPAMEFFEDFWQAPWFMAQALLGKGMNRHAVTACEVAAAMSGRTPMALGPLGLAYALDGRREDALHVLDDLETMAGSMYVGATNFAMIHGGLGNRDRAFHWLERAFRQRDMALVHIGTDTFYEPLRSDRRFAELLRRMGLEPPRPQVPPDSDAS